MSTDIQNPVPVVIPAQEEKVFNLLWVSQLQISAPNTQDLVIDVTLLPYYRGKDGVGEIMQPDPFKPETFTTKHKQLTWEELKSSPKLLNAFMALMEAVQEL